MKKDINLIIEFIKKNKIDQLGFDPKVFMTNVIEELIEMISILPSNEARVKAENIVSKIYDDLEYDISIRKYEDKEMVIDALGDIIVYSIDGIMKNGYDPKCVLTEIGKEINSRKQDPKQKERWEKEGPMKGEKWMKDINQDPTTKYKANFKICKRS